MKQVGTSIMKSISRTNSFIPVSDEKGGSGCWWFTSVELINTFVCRCETFSIIWRVWPKWRDSPLLLCFHSAVPLLIRLERPSKSNPESQNLIKSSLMRSTDKNVTEKCLYLVVALTFDLPHLSLSRRLVRATLPPHSLILPTSCCTTRCFPVRGRVQ